MEQFKVAKWGNSLAVRIPSHIVKALGLKQGDLMPSELITNSAALRARLAAAREASRMTREEATAAMIEARKHFPKHLKPEDWKIDRNDPDMRG